MSAFPPLAILVGMILWHLFSKKYPLKVKPVNDIISEYHTIIVLIFYFFSLISSAYYPSIPKEFLSTTFGVLLAASITLAQMKKQRESTNAKIRDSILTELKLSLAGLKMGEPLETLFVVRTETAAFDSAVGGGHFSLFEEETQRRISELYSYIKFTNYFSDKYLLQKIIFQKKKIKKINLQKIVEDYLSEIIERHETVIKYLEEKKVLVTFLCPTSNPLTVVRVARKDMGISFYSPAIFYPQNSGGFCQCF